MKLPRVNRDVYHVTLSEELLRMEDIQYVDFLLKVKGERGGLGEGKNCIVGKSCNNGWGGSKIPDMTTLFTVLQPIHGLNPHAQDPAVDQICP